MGTHLTASIDHLLTSGSQQVQSDSKPSHGRPSSSITQGQSAGKAREGEMATTSGRRLEYAYSYERGTQKWTPLNSNMHMQGIKVVTHAPVPQKVIQGGGDATETTLTILEIIKEKKRKENRARKEEMIQQM